MQGSPKRLAYLRANIERQLDLPFSITVPFNRLNGEWRNLYSAAPTEVAAEVSSCNS